MPKVICRLTGPNGPGFTGNYVVLFKIYLFAVKREYETSGERTDPLVFCLAGDCCNKVCLRLILSKLLNSAVPAVNWCLSPVRSFIVFSFWSLCLKSVFCRPYIAVISLTPSLKV
jgi:hypothetical protein